MAVKIIWNELNLPVGSQALWSIMEYQGSAVLHSQERGCHCDIWTVLDSDKPDVRNKIEQETHLEVG